MDVLMKEPVNTQSTFHLHNVSVDKMQQEHFWISWCSG